MTEQAAQPPVPVSQRRLEICLASCGRWTDTLPRFADRSQRKADWFAIAAGIMSTLTGLAIWPVLGEGSSWLDKTLVSAAALASAILALIPRVKNYGEQAAAARILNSQYGGMVGLLTDLIEDPSRNQQAAVMAVAQFDDIKQKKDALRGLQDFVDRDRRSRTSARRPGRGDQRDRTPEQPLSQ